MTEANLFSGEFCAELLTILEKRCSQTAAEENVDKELLKQELTELVDRHELELPLKERDETREAGLSFRDEGKGISMGDADRLRLNALLPWSSYNYLGSGNGVIGGSFNNKKRYGAQPIPDPLVRELDRRLSFSGKSVIEAGCFEGHHSISLAACGARVWGFDSRIENILKSLARAWFFGFEHAIRFDLVNLEAVSVSSFYRDTFADQELFCFHSRGVLYHLKDPVAHLIDVTKLQPEHIYLHTQIASQEMANETYNTPFGEQAVFRYREKLLSISPFSGMEHYSLWLTEEGLQSTLKRLGYQYIEVLKKKDERNGPRIQLIASKALN